MLLLVVVIPPRRDLLTNAYVADYQRFDTLSSPRMALVGGSHLSFAIDAAQVTDSLGINVQNTGVHSGIGMRYMMDEILAHAREGDIIVVMPFYEQFYDLYDGSVDGLPALVLSRLQNFKKLNASQAFYVAKGAPKYIYSNLLNLSRKKKSQAWGYSSDNYDQFGTETAHWAEESDPSSAKDFTTVANRLNKEYVEDFSNKINLLRQKGCEVYVLWPITAKSNYQHNLPQIREIEEAMAQNGIRFDAAPDYFVVDDQYVFNGPAHLNKEGSEIDTRRFIEWARNTINPK